MGAIDRYQLEAAVQSAHAVRRSTGRADWAAIGRLYDALAEITGSPVVAINRAIAIAETDGPAAGLAALAALEGDARLAQYQPYWAARAALLAAAGDIDAADAAYEQAIGLEARPGGAPLPAAPPRRDAGVVMCFLDGRHSGARLKSRNPESRRPRQPAPSSGFRVRAKTRAPERLR